MPDVKLQAILTLKDKMTNSLKKSEGALKALGKTAALAGAAVVAGIGVSAVKAASKFEKQMADVSTLISGDSTKAVGKLEKGIKSLMKEVPVKPDELGASAYSIVSAGISDTSKALKVLKASSKLAVAGLGTTEEATNLLTSAINTFAEEGKSADEISDILFKTVKSGKTTVAELSQSFGASAPVIASAGVKLADFQAATAALTTTGLPASQAQMGLRQAIVALIKPTGEMQKLFDALGVEDVPKMISESEGLGEVFRKLKNASEDQNVEWAKSLGSVEALNAVTGILDTTSKAYLDTMDAMTDGSNAIDEAFKKQTETFDAQWQILKGQLTVILINLGSNILPTLTGAIQGVIDIAGKLGEHLKIIFSEDLKATMVNLRELFKDLGFAGGEAGQGLAMIEVALSPMIGLAQVALVTLNGIIEAVRWLSRRKDDISNMLGAFVDFTQNPFGLIPGRQFGGSVTRGQPHMVGENGPELFVPREGGRIVPNGQAGGGEITINFNNPTVRSQDDLDEIIQTVKETLNRDLQMEQIGV